MTDNQTTVTGLGGDVHHFAYDFSFWSIDNKGITCMQINFKITGLNNGASAT